MHLYQGWKVVLAGAGINFLVGINYTWSIYATGLVEQLGWNYSQASLPYSLFLLCYAFLMVPTGWAQDHVGSRPIISLGSIFSGLAFISFIFFLDQPLVAAILLGVLLGIGLACCFASTTPAVIKWFPPNQKGKVTGFVVTSTGLAALIMSPFIQRLVNFGITEAFVISGIILLIGIFVLAQLITEPPLKIKDLRRIHNKNTTKIDPRLFKFWIMFFLTTGTGVTISSHLVNIMQVQASSEKGYIAVALFSLGNAAGRMIGGILSDKIGRIKSMRGVFSIIVIMIILGLGASTSIQIIVVFSLLALAFGSLFSIFPSAIVKLFGESSFGFNYGIVFTGLGAAGIFPYLGGTLYEIQGSYFFTYLLLLITTISALLISLKVRSD
ncbi:MFS transporter [Natranaerobius trueperi]|uniref:Major facilitator superfamily (MFS) profile domain-containing protein n=1 Tax=Natranaerobius trueperi TaxID=759412 RepID=A0A226BXB2_9FIRM|nr:MFS transporter [Natranaerobius trueperi]OWZ82839.1 hypothetical protein CDO51_11945 [Natranaerobius trueperi]